MPSLFYRVRREIEMIRTRGQGYIGLFGAAIESSFAAALPAGIMAGMILGSHLSIARDTERERAKPNPRSAGLSCFAVTAGLLVAVNVLSLIALRSVPDGTEYVLLPHGAGIACHILEILLLSTALGVFGATGAIAGNRTFHLIWSKGLFGLLLCVLVAFQLSRPVAVVETARSFTFVRPVPVRPIIVARRDVYHVEASRNRAFTLVRVDVGSAGTIHFPTVWRMDPTTEETVETLYHSLGLAGVGAPVPESAGEQSP